jgi:uncharacterized protein YndB with AHSA1/START domain
MVLRWDEYGSYRARVEAVEPPHHFAFRWARRADDELREGNSTLVQFTLTAEGGQTRLRVVETGFRALEATDEEKVRAVEGNSQGWREELDELRQYAAQVARAAT